MCINMHYNINFITYCAFCLPVLSNLGPKIINGSPCYLPASSRNRWLKIPQHKSQHNQHKNKVISTNGWALSSKFKTSHSTNICLLYLDKLQTWAEGCWCFLKFSQTECCKCKIKSILNVRTWKIRHKVMKTTKCSKRKIGQNSSLLLWVSWLEPDRKCLDFEQLYRMQISLFI